MPVRDQYRRIQVLDQILANAPGGLTARQVLDRLNEKLELRGRVSLRTLQNDIAALKEGQFGTHVPLVEERRGRQILYKYQDPEFSLYAFNLNQAELQQIRHALTLLERSGRYFMPLEQLKRKISPLDPSLPAIEFDDNPDYIGLQWMQKITDGISRPICLSVTYRPFERQPYVIQIHPYRLREYNNRWYLCGLAEPKKSPPFQTVLALDRIEKLEFCPEIAYEPSTFDQEYFEDVIGITVDLNEPVQRVRLQFEPSRAEYVRTKPLHRTQRGPYERENGWQEFTIDVRLNRELVATLLSFGHDVYVLEPERLRNDLVESLSGALSHYQD